MWLYRIISMDNSGFGHFYDATHSLDKAIQKAKLLEKENSLNDISIDAENWDDLTLTKYYIYKALKFDDGFGVNFKQKYNFEITEIKQVWPKD